MHFCLFSLLTSYHFFPIIFHFMARLSLFSYTVCLKQLYSIQDIFPGYINKILGLYMNCYCIFFKFIQNSAENILFLLFTFPGQGKTKDREPMIYILYKNDRMNYNICNRVGADPTYTIKFCVFPTKVTLYFSVLNLIFRKCAYIN